VRALRIDMRLRSTLLDIAVLLTAGCGGSAAAGGSPDASSEAAEAAGGSPDAGEPAEAACGGCNCEQPSAPSGNATPQQACELVSSFQGVSSGNSSACEGFCARINDSGSGSGAYYFCTVPTAYVDAYGAAVGDGGAGSDAGADAGLTCPAWSGSVVVECSYECLGRRTDGILDSPRSDDRTLGDVFAGRAYLEEVSVHAFQRLERELLAHGAPEALLHDTRRARRDEVRHTAMMARLARRFAGTPRSPRAPGATPVRSLLAIAIENAVEGCVRETYGAVVGLIEARCSSDRGVRRAMETIGADECRHAELSWAIAQWVMPRLTAEERDVVRRAAREAIAQLANEGDARVVQVLNERVWERAA
jgi:hypothetical protein